MAISNITISFKHEDNEDKITSKTEILDFRNEIENLINVDFEYIKLNLNERRWDSTTSNLAMYEVRKFEEESDVWNSEISAYDPKNIINYELYKTEDKINKFNKRFYFIAGLLEGDNIVDIILEDLKNKIKLWIEYGDDGFLNFENLESLLHYFEDSLENQDEDQEKEKEYLQDQINILKKEINNN